MVTKNYQIIKHELLQVILRGKNTRSVSKRLGCSFDKVGRWKNGTKQFKWNEFCQLCFLLKIPLHLHLNEVGISVSSLQASLKIISYLRNLNLEVTTQDLAKAMNTSAPTLRRYINQSAYPEVEFVFEMMDLRSDLSEVLIESLGCQRKNKIVSGFFKYPWMGLVINAMGLKKFLELPEFSNEWIARHLDLSVTQVNLALHEMVYDLKILEKRGGHYWPADGAPKNKTIVTSGLQYERDKYTLLHFIIKKSLERIGRLKNFGFVTEEGDCMPYRIFSCSEENVEQINKVIMKAESDIHTILSTDRGEANDVRILIFQHFSALNRDS